MDVGEEFSLHVEEDTGDGVVVRVRGEVDVVSSPPLYECLKNLGDRQMVTVDLSGVTFLDSSGLSALVVTCRARESAGGELVLRGVKPAQMKLFELTGLDEVFTFLTA